MFEVFEHTADVGLLIRAADQEHLFIDAARGLESLMVENLDKVDARRVLGIELQAGNLEDLLFDWLAELLYRFDARHLVFSRFVVHIEGTHLRAEVAGDELDPARHVMGREVKAITYHGLSVRQSPDGWVAEVIVDV